MARKRKMTFGIVTGRHIKPHTLVNHLDLYRNRVDALVNIVDDDERILSILNYPRMIGPENPSQEGIPKEEVACMLSIKDGDIIRKVRYSDRFVLSAEKAIKLAEKLGVMNEGEILRTKGGLYFVSIIRDISFKDDKKTVYDASNGGWNL